MIFSRFNQFMKDLVYLMLLLTLMKYAKNLSTRKKKHDPASNAPSFINYNPDFSDSPLEESDFFERFEQHVKECGFCYKRDDLIAFHLSVKCGEITILGGSSGTGKSSLPKLYSQTKWF